MTDVPSHRTAPFRAVDTFVPEFIFTFTCQWACYFYIRCSLGLANVAGRQKFEKLCPGPLNAPTDVVGAPNKTLDGHVAVTQHDDSPFSLSGYWAR